MIRYGVPIGWILGGAGFLGGSAMIATETSTNAGIVLVFAGVVTFVLALGFMHRDDKRQIATAPAAAGWYPHPTMAGTQQYWDGANWTDNIAPVGRATGANPAAMKRIAWGISLMFALPVIYVTFLDEPSYGGIACGTWISPNFDSSDAVTLVDSVIIGRCNDKLSEQRTLALVLLGLGGGARLVIPSIVRAARE